MPTDVPTTVAERAEALCVEWEDDELALEAAQSELETADAPLIAAWILHHRLGRTDEAASILDGEPTIADADAACTASLQVEIARAGDDNDALVAALFGQLETLDDGEARVTLYLELAALMRSLAAGEDGARLVLERAVREAPDNATARAAWRQAAGAEQTAELYRDVLTELDADATAVRGALHAALFEIYRDELDDPVLAEAQALLAYEHDPECAAVHEAVLQALDASGDEEAALALAHRRFDDDPADLALRDDLLRRTQDDAERLRALREHREATDVDAASLQLEAELTLQLEDDVDTTTRLLENAHDATQSDDAAECALALLADVLDDEERAAWLLRVADRAPANRAAEVSWEAAVVLEELGDTGAAAAAVAMHREQAASDEQLSLLVRIDDALPGSRASLDLLRRWTEAAPSGAQRAARHLALADRRAEVGEDPTDDLEAAIAEDPNRHDITIRLAERYLQAEDWTAAEVVLARVTRLGEAVASGDDLAQLWAHLALTRRKLAQPAGAAIAWCGVLDHAADAPLRRRAIEALVRDAYARDALEHAERALEEAERLLDTSDASLAHAVGELLRRVGRTDESSSWHRRALELQPTHTQALRALTLEEETQDVDTLLALARSTEDKREQFATVLRLADAYEARGDREDAIATLELAAEMQPDAREPLHRMLAMHKADEAWDLACEVLLRLTRLETEPDRAARFLLAIASLERDELARPARAVRAFGQALDIKPRDASIWQQLSALLGDLGWWAELQAAVTEQQARLHRVDAPVSERAHLEVILGDVVSEHLDNPDEAIAAWQRALALTPGDVEILERIARTYPRNGKGDARLIDEHRAILAVAPDRPASHYLLHLAYKRQRAYDLSWLHAAALRILGDDDARAEAFFLEHRPPQVKTARRGLNDAEWRKLESGVLSDAGFSYLRALSRWTRRLVARAPGDWGLHPRRDRHTAESLGEAAGLFAYLPGALGVSLNAVYGSAAHSGIHIAGFEEPAVVVGGDVLARPVDRSMVFAVARACALLHPSLLLAGTVGHPESLHALVGGCFALSGLAEEGLPAEAEAWRDALASEHPEVVQHVIQTTRAYAAAGGSARDAQRWPHAAETVACRAAVLLSGDLLRSVEAIQLQSTGLSAAPLGDRLIELLAFWGSEAHSELRAELGLGLGQ